MKITRIINNNVICAVDERNHERILLGSGIGFQKQKGQDVDKNKIEKEFFLKSKSVAGKLYALLAQIPMEYMKVTKNIIEYAKECTGKELNENLYLTLTDHINFAVARYKQGLAFSNALLWEIKRFYPVEFSIGMKAIDLIRQEFEVDLPEDEAASIAMHIVNAELGSDIGDTVQVTEFIQNVLNVVRYHYQINFDEESLHYSRFVTHLKFFGYRLLKNTTPTDQDLEFQEMVKLRYPTAYECSLKIADFIKKKYNKELVGDELVYLTVHIKRITMDEQLTNNEVQ